MCNLSIIYFYTKIIRFQGAINEKYKAYNRV